MPVSCISDNEEPPAKCCKFCDESTESGDGGGGPVSWRLTLDQDLIDTLKNSFPSWFSGDESSRTVRTKSPSISSSQDDISSSSISSSSVNGKQQQVILYSPEPLSTSPIAERSNGSSVSSSSSSSSGVSSNESGGGTPTLSFRSSSISSANSFPPSPPSLVIYATQIEQPPGQRAIYQQFLSDMAEGQDKSAFKLPASSEPPRLHIVDGLSFEGVNTSTRQTSPPKAIVDSSPLQPAMDKNKESLKVKLLVRRPITQLVEQGIIPPLKTSPAIHEQRKQLERAKTGDLLKAKIQQRPNRQELERRHILEHEESHVDPSLAEKQRMLKKARLADQLNSQISHRPGPLELIKKNILHVEEPIERIVKEGLVSFKATSEGLLNRPQQPNSYVTFEDDSQNSSESGDQRISPPRSDVGIVTVALTIPTSGGAVVVTSGPILQTTQKMPPALMAVPPTPPPPPPPPLPIQLADIKTEIKSEPVIIKSETPQRFAELCQSVVGTMSMSPSPTLVPIYPTASNNTFSLGSPSLAALSPLSSVASPQSLSRLGPSPLPVKFDAPGKDKYRKKSKCKPATKARPIKFHEYKGPPNAQKSSSMSQAQTEETSYQLLLKQQNFLLEYLEGLHKQPINVLAQQPPKPQILMMTETNFVHKPSFATVCNNSNATTSASIISSQQPVPSPATSIASSTTSVSVAADSSSSSSVVMDQSKLEKMKVSDLKLQLKKRNLPVSGPKPQLIERLKPYLLQMDAVQVKTEESNVTTAGEVAEITDFDAVSSPHLSLSPTASEHELMDVQQVDSPAAASQQTILVSSLLKEDLVREQQRKIDELQRKLRESQEELLQMKQNHTAATQIQSTREQPVNQKLIFKQQLEAKIQKEKMQQIENLQRQQKEYLANQQQVLKNAAAAAAAIARNNKTINAQLQNGMVQAQAPTPVVIKKEAPALAFNENALQQLASKKNVEIVWNGEQALFLVGLQPQQHQQPTDQDGNNNRIVSGNQQRATTLPGILVPITSNGNGAFGAATLTTQQLSQPIFIQHKLRPSQQCHGQVTAGQLFDTLANDNKANGPSQNGAELQRPVAGVGASNKGKRVHRNSQMITDVLEILIKNGDLPESAAQVPVTPTTTPHATLIMTTNDRNSTAEPTSENSAKPMLIHTEPVSPATPNVIVEPEELSIPSHHDTMGELDISTMLGNLNDSIHGSSELEAVQGVSSTTSGMISSQDHQDHDDYNVTKTLDMLLNGGHQESHAIKKTPDRHNGASSSSLGANDVVLNNSLAEPCKMDTEGSRGGVATDGYLSVTSCPTEEMDHFDEFEFMTLMKLGMEIGEDSTCIDNNHRKFHTISEGAERQEPSQSTSIFNGFGGEGVTSDLGTASVGESPKLIIECNNNLLQQQGQFDSRLSSEGGADTNGNRLRAAIDLNVLNNNNNRYSNDTPMDIEDFSNSLSAFDFPFDADNRQMVASATGQTSSEQPDQRQPIMGDGSPYTGMVSGGTVVDTERQANNVGSSTDSSSMNFDALAGFGHNNNNNSQQQSQNVFGSINSLNDQLGLADVPPSLLYDSHLPMGHDYSLELFDDLRIPTESMSWNDVDFPIYGK